MVEGAQISEKVSLFFCRYNAAEYRMERNERFPSLLIIAEHSLMGQTRKRCKCILRMHSHILLTFDPTPGERPVT